MDNYLKPLPPSVFQRYGSSEVRCWYDLSLALSGKTAEVVWAEYVAEKQSINGEGSIESRVGGRILCGTDSMVISEPAAEILDEPGFGGVTVTSDTMLQAIKWDQKSNRRM